MLIHISDVLLPGSDRIRPISVAFVVSILLILVLRGIALRALMLGCGEIMSSIGANDLSARARTLARHITAAVALLLVCLLTALILALAGARHLPRLLLNGAVPALVYYVVAFILVVHYTNKAADVIAVISE